MERLNVEATQALPLYFYKKLRRQGLAGEGRQED